MKGDIMLDHKWTTYGPADLARMTPNEAQGHMERGVISQLEYEAYMLGWETSRPGQSEEERYVIERGYHDEVKSLADEIKRHVLPVKRTPFRF